MIQTYYNYTHSAKVAKLVDALGLGPSAARCGGSSPPLRIFEKNTLGGQGMLEIKF